MRKLLKYLVGCLIIGACVLWAYFAYWGREQTFDFSTVLPAELVFCGVEIDESDEEYQALKAWLRINTTGWRRIVASYPSDYKGRNISVTTSNKAVIVDYHGTDGNKGEQVFRGKAEHELPIVCERENFPTIHTLNAQPLQ